MPPLLSHTPEGQRLYCWKIGPSEYLANPECGARLMSWTIHMAGNTPRQVIYWPESTHWKHPEKIRGGNPILFPFVARSYLDGIEGMWQPKHGAPLPMPRHGFARAGHFKLIEITENGFCAELVPKQEDQHSYPFDYRFQVHYTFEELGLKVMLSLENLGSSAIPWCAGHHFYFTLPWHPALSRKHYTLFIPAKKSFYHATDGSLIPGDKPKQEESFADPKLLDRIHTKLTQAKLRFGPKNAEELVSMQIGEDPIPSPWTSVTTWTEAEDSPFYCVEPWMGPPNATGHQQGLHWVAPGQKESFIICVFL